jgi:hypothetical protein
MDIELSPRGSFYTSFFHMYVDGHYEGDILAMSKKDLGTFVHEYIHYLQNVTTIFGLKYSETKYSEMIYLKSTILAAEYITLPINLTDPNYQRAVMHYSGLVGCRGTLNTIDSCSIRLRSAEITEGLKPVMRYYIDFNSAEGKPDSFIFGAHIIKEGMAYLYQRFFDPTVPKKDDIPYNFVKILCDKFYPAIACDDKKLICICYASLFSANPAEAFFRLCDMAKVHSGWSGVDLYCWFMDTEVLCDRTGRYSAMDYLPKAIEGFRDKLGRNLMAYMDYTEEMLNRVRAAIPAFPILNILYEPEFPNIDLLDKLIGYYGIPFVQTPYGYSNPKKAIPANGEYNDIPATDDSDENDFIKNSSVDVIELMSQRAFVSSLMYREPCSLLSICLHCGWDDHNCQETPWLHEPPCMFTAVSTPFDLSSKIRQNG